MHSLKTKAIQANPGNRKCSGEQPFPDYPSSARSFIRLDSRLLPYWHMLFDLCPDLLKVDPPEGRELFRQFMVWAYWQQPAQDWTFHVNVCRWLLQSEFAALIGVSHIENLMSAAAARWISHDNSQAQGILLSCSVYSATVVDWKEGVPTSAWSIVNETDALPPARFDFAWSPLSRVGTSGFRRWLRIPQ